MLPIAKFEIGFIDDPFLRPSLNIYVCGCWHKCKNCQNKELQDPDSELCQRYTLSQICQKIDTIKNSFVKSIVYLGGDFGFYPIRLFEISKFAHECNLANVFYTGFKLEDINPKYLAHIDVVIDGKYIEELKQDSFPASLNQRVWVKKEGRFVAIDPKILPINQHNQQS